MPTIQMTRPLGELLTLLRSPNRALAIQRGWSRVLVETPGNCFSTNHDLAKMLKKMGLLEQRVPEGAPSFWHSWYGNFVYVLSDAGKAFPLPPEEFWLEE